MTMRDTCARAKSSGSTCSAKVSEFLIKICEVANSSMKLGYFNHMTLTLRVAPEYFAPA